MARYQCLFIFWQKNVTFGNILIHTKRASFFWLGFYEMVRLATNFLHICIGKSVGLSCYILEVSGSLCWPVFLSVFLSVRQYFTFLGVLSWNESRYTKHILLMRPCIWPRWQALPLGMLYCSFRTFSFLGSRSISSSTLRFHQRNLPSPREVCPGVCPIEGGRVEPDVS